jgi:hypothetical protein
MRCRLIVTQKLIAGSADGSLSGYHKKKYVCKVRTHWTCRVAKSDQLLATVHLHSWMECRFRTFGGCQLDLSEQVLGEADWVFGHDPVPPRATRTVAFGREQYKERLDGPQ